MVESILVQAAPEKWYSRSRGDRDAEHETTTHFDLKHLWFLSKLSSWVEMDWAG
jgi:hypothetical protein